MFDSLVTSVGAYPSAVKILILMGCSITIVGVALVVRARNAQKKNSLALQTTEKKIPVFMKLKRIQLFPEDPTAEIQIVAYVNGLKFVHPSSDEQKWMLADDSMSEKVIELPSAEMYYIRFEINFSSDKKLEGGPALARLATKDLGKTVSPATAAFPTIPFVQEYKLYLLQDGSRDTSVKAVIPYEIYVE